MEKSIMATAKKSSKISTASRIRNYISAHPEAKAEDIAIKFGTTKGNVYVIRSAMRKIGKKLIARKTLPQTALIPDANPTIVEKHFGVDIDKVHDPVNHPSHYKVGGIETIDFIEAKGLNYNLGNAIKYITRADYKGSKAQDLAKAIWYLRREITNNVPNNT
jgi:hypothetical protein